jgi:SAM-dependent methyltransferase
MSVIKEVHSRTIIRDFTCNVCGGTNHSDGETADRERVICDFCRSSMRFRSIALVLSRVLFGADLKLRDFPSLRSVRGLGISDSETYCGSLSQRFSYTNTFYHREPTLDLCQPDEKEFGKYDFVICSDVLEHVSAPVDRAFNTLARLLKPAGVLILTVPYSLERATVEHFAHLHETGLAEIGGKLVLVNRSRDGNYEVIDQLSFHGGQGSTLEMRLFSEADIRELLNSAGLTHVRFDSVGNHEFGVAYSSPCSLPIVACAKPFSLGLSGIRELTSQIVSARAVLDAARESRWVRLGRRFGVGPKIPLYP